MEKVFGAWLAIVIVLVAILAVLVYKNANRKVYITQYDDKSGSENVLYDYGFRRKSDRS